MLLWMAPPVWERINGFVFQGISRVNRIQIRFIALPENLCRNSVKKPWKACCPSSPAANKNDISSTCEDKENYRNAFPFFISAMYWRWFSGRLGDSINRDRSWSLIKNQENLLTYTHWSCSLHSHPVYMEVGNSHKLNQWQVSDGKVPLVLFWDNIRSRLTSYDMNPKEQVSPGPHDIYSHQISVLLIDLLKYGR